MFGGNNDFIPRTYSVKSYRARKSIKLKKVLMYFTILVLSIVIAGVTFLSMNKLV